MSEQPPPNPFPINPIFNPSDWIYGDTALTIAIADQRYLKKSGDTATGIITFNAGLISNALATFNADIYVKNLIRIQDDTNPTTQYTSLTTLGNSFTINTLGTTPSVSLAVNGSNYFNFASVSGAMTLAGTSLALNTTNAPTCTASSAIATSDSSTKIPSTAWVKSVISTPVQLVSTSAQSGYNVAGNYTYWYFTTYPTWTAYSWIFYTPKTSRTNVNKTNLGSSPPLNVGTISANGSFIYMTGNGISQGYTATSSTMITYCAGFQQQYTISAGATASILSVINCIGATPASPIFQSNQLSENNGTCPPTANGLSGYIIMQVLNGDYTGLGFPTMVFTQTIA